MSYVEVYRIKRITSDYAHKHIGKIEVHIWHNCFDKFDIFLHQGRRTLGFKTSLTLQDAIELCEALRRLPVHRDNFLVRGSNVFPREYITNLLKEKGL